MSISPFTESPSSTQTLETSAAHPTKHNHIPYSILSDSNDENPSLFLFNSISSRNKTSRSDDVTEVIHTSDPDVVSTMVAMPPPTADFSSSRRHDANVCDYTSMLQKFSTASLRLELQSPNQRQTNFLSPQCLGQEQGQESQGGFVPRASKAQYNHFSNRQRNVFDFHHSTRIKIFLGYLEDIDTVPEDVRYWHDETCFIIKDRYPKVRAHN
ncbi:hypothetical protein BGZ67_005995 [Mortierella alpina]|nr:hypothetical protein BGZ67_005995 [Mortierella alpina]